MPQAHTADRVTLADRLRVRQRPKRTHVMHHSWQDLLFIHWKIPVEVAQSWLPKGLTVDSWGGSAWVGIVPFKMREIRPRNLPSLPWVSDFLELNVRTYAVNENGVPGVWFLSLDASRWLAVYLARAWFGLPYFHAEMSCRRDPDGATDYRCYRYGQEFQREDAFRWKPEGSITHAELGTLEFFLIERYVLFSVTSSGQIASGRVSHPPYPLQKANLTAWSETPLILNGIERFGTPPDHAIASPGVHVEVFGLETP